MLALGGTCNLVLLLVRMRAVHFFSERGRLVIVPHIHSGKPAGQVTVNTQCDSWLNLYIIVPGCNLSYFVCVTADFI